MAEVDSGRQGTGSIIKVVLDSYPDKQKAMKAAPMLRGMDSDNIDTANIFYHA